jgi:hypothetical protein
MEFHDYSNRRGVLVPLLPKVHAMYKENSVRDRLSAIEPPEHLITWQHKQREILVDINRRFLVALDGNTLVGVLFYRHAGKDIYIEDLQIAWPYRNNPHIIDGFLKRLEYDPLTKEAVFYASERIKIEADEEVLVAKGLKKKHIDGWENLGSFSKASLALKLRYNRGI